MGYVFQSTDGYGNSEVSALSQLIRGELNYFGFLDVDPYADGREEGWATSGSALLSVPPDVKPHVGMSRVSSADEALEAFKKILTKEKAKEA